MSRRSGLGRGLAALIPPSANTPDDATQSAEAGTDPATDQSDGVTVPAAEGPPPPPTHTDDPAANEGAPDVAGNDPTQTWVSSAEDSSDLDTAPREPTDHAGSFPGNPPGQDATTGDTSVRDETQASHQPVVQATTATLAELAPDQIVTNPRQPREVFDPEELEGLAVSLQEMGVLQPLVVRHRSDGAYELIAGERRLRAAKIAGLVTVPALVRHTEDGDLLKEALVENIHRVQLNPLEEGAAYQQLLEEFGATKEELAAKLGKSRPAISNAVRLLQLPPAVQRRVAAGVLSAGHAKALLAIDNPRTQADIADRIVAEGMSVRATEELVRLRLSETPTAPSRKKRTPTAPGLVELQQDLSDALMARVKINMGARKGRVAIEFSTVDDLERIVGVIANGLGTNQDSLGTSPQPGSPPAEGQDAPHADEAGS